MAEVWQKKRELSIYNLQSSTRQSFPPVQGSVLNLSVSGLCIPKRKGARHSLAPVKKSKKEYGIRRKSSFFLSTFYFFLITHFPLIIGD